MSVYLGETPIAVNSSSRNIGEIIQSTIPLSDAGLHLLDGSSISGSGAYSAFVNYMANLYSTAAKVSNINVVGTLTDNNGVISGFSATDYALLTNDFPSSLSTEDWEFVIPYKTTSLSSIQYPMCSNDYGIGFGIITNGQFILYISSNGTSWDIASGVSSTLTVQANTQYYFKLGHIKSSNTTYLDVSTDKENYTRYLSVSMSVAMQNTRFKFGVSRSNADAAINGSIDLNECYININGSRWWTGRNPECFTDESQWQQSVTDYGVCGKFVYDSVNNTVRLPKITGFTEGTIDPTVLGDLVEAGLPNITGVISMLSTKNGYVSGCFEGTTASADTGRVQWQSGAAYGALSMDASRSSSIYGNSTTVQPQSIKVLYYIVIATSTKTQIEVDIDEVMTDLNGKADVDLSNVKASGTSLASGWSMPSSRYIDLTLGASGATYTAPVNGWFTIAFTATASHYCFIKNSSTKIGTSFQYGAGSSVEHSLLCPAIKGEPVVVNYGGITLTAFRFIYAEGENV